MIWFYNQMEEVMVPSAGTRLQLCSHGLPLEPPPKERFRKVSANCICVNPGVGRVAACQAT
jgi:hypothetical protein